MLEITGSSSEEVAVNFSIKFPYLIIDWDSIEIVEDGFDNSNIVIASVYNTSIDRVCTNFALGVIKIGGI